MVHEIGHNLGMKHDFIDNKITYKECRKTSDGSKVSCSSCANYQPDNDHQPIGMPTGHRDDCCNGFLGYYDHPHYWSKCSVRFLEEFYVFSRKYDQCMDTPDGNQFFGYILVAIDIISG